MRTHRETLEEFRIRTCNGVSEWLKEISEEGIVVRECYVIAPVLLATEEIGEVATCLEIRIPWDALDDALRGKLKPMPDYALFARIIEIGHFGAENEVRERDGNWHLVCGEPTEDEELFQEVVQSCLENKFSDVVLDILTRKKIATGLFCRDPGRNEEESPLL
jgi:hypothetical protein